MSTETILTYEQRLRMVQDQYNGDPIEFARAIEQAVLQSPEIQAMRKDAGRLDWIESQFGADIVCFDTGQWEISSVDIFAEGPNLRATINAAMEQQT